MRSILDLTVASFLAVVTMFLLYTQGRTWEGHISPVVKNFEITKVKRVNIGFEIEGHFEKVRQCDYVSIAWYREGVTAARRVSVSFGDQPAGTSQSRAGGLQWFGVWTLGRPRDALGPDRYFAVVRHECHPFWVTQTPIGPVDLSKID